MDIMKKLFLVVSMCLLLCGCRNYQDIKILGRSDLTTDNATIQVENKYIFKGFSKETTKDGCIVTIYYELDEANNE